MEILDNIKFIREKKGYSHEAMGMSLGISQTAYTNMENNKTKLTLDRLYKIADILEVKIEDLLKIEPKTFKQNIYNNQTVTAISQQQVENLYQECKEAYEKLIKSKDDQIALLRAIVEKKNETED
ncbi:MAG: helix-turn-helix domain-containing protein [Marinilabiliaceae bacterium]|nr:helix-turn-helix domain-containing protein [Marinilabiliaceae bacterium]